MVKSPNRRNWLHRLTESHAEPDNRINYFLPSTLLRMEIGIRFLQSMPCATHIRRNKSNGKDANRTNEMESFNSIKPLNIACVLHIADSHISFWDL